MEAGGLGLTLVATRRWRVWLHAARRPQGCNPGASFLNVAIPNSDELSSLLPPTLQPPPSSLLPPPLQPAASSLEPFPMRFAAPAEKGRKSSNLRSSTI